MPQTTYFGALSTLIVLVLPHVGALSTFHCFSATTCFGVLSTFIVLVLPHVGALSTFHCFIATTCFGTLSTFFCFDASCVHHFPVFAVHAVPAEQPPARGCRDPGHPQPDRVRGPVLLSRQAGPVAGGIPIGWREGHLSLEEKLR